MLDFKRTSPDTKNLLALRCEHTVYCFMRPCMTSTYCTSAGYCVICFSCWCNMHFGGVLEIFLPVGLSVSFCLSDGCEGQSLLAVSQNGLSLSLASLFSGICGLERRESYMQAVCTSSASLGGSWWLCFKLMILCLLIPPADLVKTQSRSTAICFSVFCLCSSTIFP